MVLVCVLCVCSIMDSWIIMQRLLDCLWIQPSLLRTGRLRQPQLVIVLVLLLIIDHV